MTDNIKLIEKADAALADLASGGRLSTQQAQRFLTVAIDQSKLLKLCTTKTFESQDYELPKLSGDDTFLVGGQENVALTEADRTKLVPSKTVLTPKEFVGEVDLPYSYFEDNVEGEALQNTIIDFVSRMAARDMEKAIIRGDTTLAATTKENRLLRQFNGILKQITTTVPDFGPTPTRLDKAKLETIARALPSRFRDEENNAFLTSPNAAMDWATSQANRQTALGDTSLQARFSQGPKFGNAYVMGFPLFPEALGSGTNETVCLFGNPKQIWVGFRRQITLEYERNIRSRVWTVVATVRVDVKLEHEPGWVKGIGILASA